MRRPSFLLTLLLLFPHVALALQSLGGELEIATLDDSTTEPRPSAASASDGTTAVVWADRAHGVRARFLGADGAPSSDILDIVENQPLASFPGQGTVYMRRDPVATFERNGTLLVLWTEETAYEEATYFEDHYTVLERDVLAQRFARDGSPAGPAFRVNPTINGYQSRPSIARLRCSGANPRACGDGFLAVVWQGEDPAGGLTPAAGLFGRILDADDRPMTGQLRIASPGLQRDVVLAGDELGNFVALWDDLGDGNGRAVFARRFNAQGRALNRPAILNRRTGGHQMRPALAYANGGYLAVWQSPTGHDVDQRVFGVLLDRNGRARSNELGLSQGRAQWELLPALITAGGSYLLTWMDWNSGQPDTVVAVPLSPTSAQRAADEQPISTGRLAPQYGIRAAVRPDGQVLVIWEGQRGTDTTIAGRWLDP